MTKGGAVAIYSTAQVSSVLIDNVLFKGNRNTSRNGGALAFNTMTTKSTISNCTFMDNTAALYGGAVYYENSTGNNQIINSTFVGNAALSGVSVAAYSSYVTIDSSTFISNSFATQGTGSRVSVENSIVAGTAAYTSATITYTGINLARKTSGEPAINAVDVFTAYTSGTLQKISEHNYVAPIIIDGPAFKKISTPRSLPAGQNGFARKTPLSDIGAFEASSSFIMNFNLNGGEGSTPSAQTIEYGALAAAPTDPTRTGYTFTGWNTAQDGSGMAWVFSTETMPANNVTLYAQWAIGTYNLQFNLNGGEGTTPSPQTIKYGELAMEPTNPIRNGYTFVGWNTKQDGSGDAWDFAVSTMPGNNVTLFAQWVEDAKPKPPLIIKLPKTGDSSTVMGLSALLISVGSILLIIQRKKYKKR